MWERVMMKLTSIFLAAFTAAISPAAAADFTGPRVEARIGYDRASANEEIDELDAALTGLTYGAAVGLDGEIGTNIIAGIDAAISFSEAGETVQLGLDRASVNVDRDIEIALRAGTRVAPGALLYAKAGYANTRFTGRYYNVVGPDQYEVDPATRSDKSGFRLGTGAELAISSRAFAKGEYRYTSYGDDVSRNEILVGIGTRF
jgi:outer membrane immunogenic protein